MSKAGENSESTDAGGVGVPAGKPQHLSNERWKAHSGWMSVLRGQVDEHLRKREARLFRAADKTE